MGRTLKAAAVVAIAGFVVSANAEVFHFRNITNNAGEDLGQQLAVQVTNGGSGTVNFTFTNAIGIQSNVAEIYFMDGTILGINTITNEGTTFFETNPLNPGNLPGGSSVAFYATEAFSVDSDTPGGAPNDGIDTAMDFVTINYEVTGNFGSVMNAIYNRELWIGVHVRSIGSGGQSDSYVLDGNGIIPLPSAAMLGGVGLIGLAGVRRRR